MNLEKMPFEEGALEASLLDFQLHKGEYLMQDTKWKANHIYFSLHSVIILDIKGIHLLWSLIL